MSTIHSKLHRCLTASALITAALMPAVLRAETFNMPQFGRVEKTVSEPIEFYDLQGPEQIRSTSTNNSFSTVVFTPANPGEAVQIKFSRIHLKGDGSSYPVSLSIFNGNYNEDITYPTSTSAVTTTDFPDNGKLLARYAAYDKSTIEVSDVTFTSTEEDGSLSVCFLYKYAAACEGWEATVTSVTLTDQTITGITADYTGVTPSVYAGLKDVTLGSVTAATDGILNTYTVTSLGFKLDDPNNVIENLRLYIGNTPIDATPTVAGDIYTYTLSHELASGDNIFTVKGDIATDAPFYSTASLIFTDLITDAPSTPAIIPGQPQGVTVAALVMMPADGSTVTARVEEGKSVLFYDNGGPTANYPENTSGTVSFIPAEGSTGKVMLDFSSIALFNTNPARNDQLIVYNGTTADPDNILITLLTQSTARVRSTSDDGALTVTFSTTTGVTKAGWEATATLFTPQPMTLVGTDVTAASTADVAAGDTGCAILRVKVVTDNTEPPLNLSAVSLDFDGTSPQWEKAAVYSSANSGTFDVAGATLLAESVVADQLLNLTLPTPLSLLEGDNYIWVVADIAPDAQTGSAVNATVTSLTLNDEVSDVTPAASSTGRNVYNIAYPSSSHPVKIVYGSMNLSHKPYSSTYGGYDGSNTDQLITFLPAHEGNVCEIDFSKLNLYYYTSTYYPSSNVTPTFEVYAGSEATGTPLYTHTKDLNLKAGDDPSLIGTIRSTADNGALTIRFNAGTTSSSYVKDSQYGFLGEVREYLSRPMQPVSATGLPTGLSTIAISSASDVPVIGVDILTEGNLDAVTLDNITFALKGDASIYTSLKLASSGHKAIPANATVIATADATGATVTFTPAVTLGEGENHYWLLADISPDAVPGSVIDAAITGLTVNGSEMTVTDNDPDGEIITVNTYDPILGNTEQVVEVGEYPIQINGVTAAYMTNNYTITARPAVEGGKITATFTEGAFNVNTSNQYITVIGGDQPFGVDYDTVYPVSVTSVREDGQLIIEYHSLTIGKDEGWKCILSSDARKPLEMTGFASLPSASAETTRGSEILLGGVKFDVTGDKDPITLTALSFDIPDAGEIFTDFRLYATGDDPTFLRNDLVAESTDASTTLTFTTPVIISTPGTRHYWLLGTVRPDAVINATTTVTPHALSYTTDTTPEGIVDLSALDTNSLTVIEGFHGTYRIGSSIDADYIDFASAVNAMRAGIEGPVKFVVEPGTYNERVELDHIQGASAVNTITFEGETGDPGDVLLISNDWAEPPYSDDKLEHYYGVFTLRGTSNVTLSGMTVKTTDIGFPSVIHIAAGSSDFTLDRCIVTAPTSTSTYNNLALVNSYVGPSATSLNNRLTVTDSDLNGGYCGIRFGSFSVNQPESEGVTITGCTFSGQGYQAIYLYFSKDVIIRSNVLKGVATSTDKNYFQTIDLDISGPASIERNLLTYSKTGSYGLYLRRLAGSDESPVIIANNILDIDAGSNPGAGIQLYNSASKPYTGVTIAHNTVVVKGDDVVMPLIISTKSASTVSGLIANNILVNTTGSYVIKEQYGPAGFNWQSNAGYTSGDTYAYWGGDYDTQMTFNQWELASGESAGVNAPLTFDDSDETRPLWPDSFAQLNCGTPLSAVTEDYRGVTRSTTTPTIGAYEYHTSALTDIDPAQSSAHNAMTATDLVTVNADDDLLCIYSLDGRLRHTAHVKGETTVAVDQLPRGIYLMTLGDRAMRLILH